jgi:hypothetical protein
MIRHFSQKIAIFIVVASSLFLSSLAQAQNRVALRSDDFREVTVTAAYATAFGAAGGAALLAFVPGSPIDNLRIVAGGASIGFLVGSALGFYNATQAAANVEESAPRKEMYSYDEETPEEQTMNREVDECTGNRMPSLFMGCAGRVGLGVPAVALSAGLVTVPVVDWRF